MALIVWAMLGAPPSAEGTPANRIAFSRYYGRFLARSLDNCNTCHLPLKPGKSPTSLAEFPHNVFGHRLRLLGEELRKQGKKADIPARLRLVAKEDADRDGFDNETELLLGSAPGDQEVKPDAKKLAEASSIGAQFAKFLVSYRWQPFDPVNRPEIPRVKNAAWIRNPIDAFVAAEHEARGLKPRPEASKLVLLRRVYIDLTGLAPTPAEILAFENDKRPDAYERVVDKLLASARYGERWGRHWMDVWRYSDWAGWSDGGQIRDSKPFIWRWRDWIVESLNQDKGYDRMVQEMLAADELCPEDENALRATGFLVRNFKLLSREQWMEDTLNHTSKAFLGVTMHCAKCHDHMYDPVSQQDYYRMRAIFEPHNVRTDRVPGQPDTNKDGLVRAFDADPKAATYLFIRGDERNPDKSVAIEPGTPSCMGGKYDLRPIKLGLTAYKPDRRDFVVRETVGASEKSITGALAAIAKMQSDPKTPENMRAIAEKSLLAAESRHSALLAVLQAEILEDSGKHNSDDWKRAATEATAAQRRSALLDAELALLQAQKAMKDANSGTPDAPPNSGKRVDPVAAAKTKLAEGEKALAAAKAALASPLTTVYKPRSEAVYPAESTGRRLAFARWLTGRKNPLAARVAVNQIWARHFGVGIVPSVSDFGRNGRPPSHPKLLDWLAAEFMQPAMDDGRWTIKSNPSSDKTPWSMKHLHRLIVTSATYRMASTPDTIDAKIDPDNVFLWRMSSRRMEAEVVRDNVLYTAGQLDETMGGPEIDHKLALASRRRSVYIQIAAEKESEFLKTFDGPSVSECYERKPSVVPQQALALANSELTVSKSKLLAAAVTKECGPDPESFIKEAYLRVLTRRPTAEEIKLCRQFLTGQARRITPPETGPKTVSMPADAKDEPKVDPVLRAREDLILVLFNHNDFVTVR